MKISDMNEYLDQTNTYTKIKEPLARGDCICHNLAKVDEEYKRRVPKSRLNISDGLDINLRYLKDASEAFFNTGVELITILVDDILLEEEHGIH